MKGAKMDKPLLKVCGLKKSFGGVFVVSVLFGSYL